jgi:hypothetical protein
MISVTRMRLTMVVPTLALALMPAATLTSTGCLGCTLKGVFNGLAIDVTTSQPAMTYRLEVEAAGDVLSLRFDAPDPNTPYPSLTCQAGCTAQGNSIEMRAYPFAGGADMFGALVNVRGEKRGPAQVTVRVFRDEVLAASVSASPSYEESEPNGFGCGTQVFGQLSVELH